MMNTIPRSEYPRPDLVRAEDTWLCLNGAWQFAFDFGKSGEARNMVNGGEYPLTINVPFAPESKLSGIEYTDFIPAVWYKRTFDLPTAYKQGESRLLLHFGAVDYKAKVWVNGKLAGEHRGGYTPFTLDITDLLADTNTVTLYAEDDTRNPLQPIGKQCPEYANRGCSYTRTTGIWQSVWLEAVPTTYIKKLKLTPDTDNEKLDIVVTLGKTEGATVTASAAFDGKTVATVTAKATAGVATFSLPVKNPVLWDINKPNLYDLAVTVGEDTVTSYFGMRKIAWTDRAFLLNDRPVFQRLVLDQGFYPDGIYTASTDDELRADVERSMAVGFNGARLHMKIFEPRFLYWADRLGYLVWGEYPNWGLDDSRPEALLVMLPEWLEEVERDYNHPALIGWCPFNETGKGRRADAYATVYAATKGIDPYRPYIDTSGYVHSQYTDIYDVHDYTQSPETMQEHLEALAKGGEIPAFTNSVNVEQYNFRIPYFISECGGIKWDLDDDMPAWGYGVAPKDKAEFIARYKGLMDAMLDCPYLFGFCYTQLTDVFQEKNGIYAFDRREKFPAAELKAILDRPAAIEKMGTAEALTDAELDQVTGGISVHQYNNTKLNINIIVPTETPNA